MVDEKLLRNCLILLDKEFIIEKQKESTSIWVIKEELVSDPENEEIVDTEFSELEGVRVYDENGNATDV